MQIEVIPRFKINGKYYTIDQLPPEKVKEIIRKRIDFGMEGINYERQKTAV